MTHVFFVPRSAPRWIAAAVLVAASALLASRPGGVGVAAAAGPPAADDGACTIDVSVQTVPAFSERLSCRYSNLPDFQSHDLSWETPRGKAGRTINLATGKPTTDFARLSLNDDRLPSTTSDGRKVMTPVAGHVYALESSSQATWSAILHVFPNPKDFSPVECKAGSSDPAVAGTTFKATWVTLNQNSNVVHGSSEALLNCTRIKLEGPNEPLGLVGRIAVKF
jgi:hypothetical protein